MLRYEKFYTVCMLVVAILILAALPAFSPSTYVAQIMQGAQGSPVTHIDAAGPLRILDIAIGGLLLALGNATGGQKSSTEQLGAEAGKVSAEAARSAAQALPGNQVKPGDVERAAHDGAESGVAEGLDRATDGGSTGTAAAIRRQGPFATSARLPGAPPPEPDVEPTPELPE